jgi:hypothetical protein
MTFTEKEIILMEVLARFAQGEYDTENGTTPHLDNYMGITGANGCELDWLETGLDIKIYRGVIASLVKKGLAISDEWEYDFNKYATSVALTFQGFKVLAEQNSPVVKQTVEELNLLHQDNLKG